jgi:hypothetical protein
VDNELVHAAHSSALHAIKNVGSKRPPESDSDMLLVRRHSYSTPLGRLLTIVLFSASHLVAAGATTEAQVLDQYFSQNARAARSDATIEISIEASLSKLHKSAKLRMIQDVSRIGRSVFRLLDSEGDAMVRREVIGRYLNAEVRAREAPGSKVAITPTNCRFLFQGETDYAGRSAYVYRLEPRQKRVGLFKGELWLDAQTGCVLWELGGVRPKPIQARPKRVFRSGLHDGSGTNAVVLAAAPHSEREYSTVRSYRHDDLV